jgi:hypothetical protein
MSHVAGFRLLVLLQWVLAAIGAAIELWLVSEGQSASGNTSTVGESFTIASRLDWLRLFLLILAVAATIGLVTFQRWGPRLYIAMVALFAVFMVSPGHMSMSGWAQLFLWLDGVVAGAITAWLLLAHDRLPFKR